MRLSEVVSWLVAWLRRTPYILEEDVFACSTTSVHGRMAARAFAYSIAADAPQTATLILNRVGREG